MRNDLFADAIEGPGAPPAYIQDNEPTDHSSMLLRLSDEFRKVCASVFGTGDEPPQCNIEPFTPTGTLPFKKDASSPNTVRFSAEEYTSLQLTHNFPVI